MTYRYNNIKASKATNATIGALIGAYAFMLLATVMGIIGWVMNVVKVVHLVLAHAPVDTFFIVRIVGVPVGILGAILGWF